ncbi:EAL domain-containing protein [Entomohabitans teleogrylli]|uniref:EAL domain-containing protein n=1 Tax=Entomohabitans teleogrylli TaxID=1384589 RepID=UPI00073D36BA|nr:EAL domain-containing protein [Entomohabitans teleogrylli]
MPTRKLTLLVTSVLIVAVLLPIILSIWLAHRKAETEFRNELENYSGRVLLRTTQVADQAKAALALINAQHAVPCSPQHLLQMRRLSYTHRFIQEVVWLDGLTPRCSSLEVNSQQPVFSEPDVISPGGFQVWLTAQSDLGIKHQMVALGKPPYVVLIDPASFVDVLPFGNLPLHVALVGLKRQRTFAASHALAPEILQQAVSDPLSSPMAEHHNNVYFLRRVPEINMTIVVWASRAPLDAWWRQQLLFWLPPGLLLSLLATWLILRQLRRLQSLRYRLADAIHAGRFEVHYQPIIHLESGACSGAEALIRWRQQDGSWLSPDVFIPLAEQTQQITRLTELIINHVFDDLGAWLSKHPRQHISINLAPCDLLSTHMLEYVEPRLKKWQVSAQQIAFEITERGFANPAVTGPIIARYRDAGHAIYIDDFGTGYSSLSYLEELDIDTLKIDKSFVDSLEYKNVTPHIVEMARSLKLTMIAEGVETPAQAAWLKAHHVEFAQGWLYSKALPADQFIAWFGAKEIAPSLTDQLL